MINRNTVDRHGKQLLLNGQHFADVRDERHAHALHTLLSRWHGHNVLLTREERMFLDEVFPETG